MSFEDILNEVGDYGAYQKSLIVYFLLPTACVFGLTAMSFLFMLSVPKHWCYVPIIASSNLSTFTQRTLISPLGDQCHLYNINFTDFLLNRTYLIPENTPTKLCDQGWQYDQTDYESTASTKWNLVCNNAHYISFILTLSGVGSIIGTVFYGALSDKIGRKMAFFLNIIVASVTAIASVLVADFTTFVVLKVINGFLIPSAFQQSYILVLELVSPEERTRLNGLVHFSWSIGLCILPLIAYLSKSWIILSGVIICITMILLLYWGFLPESPRWLVSREKYEEATKIMSQIASKNGKKLDETSLLQKLQVIGEKLRKEKFDGVQNSSSDLIRYPQLRKKFLIITCCWTANEMAYYGLQLNVTNLTGNEFINFFLLSLVEIPSYLIFSLISGKFGRRWCTASGFLFSGTACMLTTINLQYMDVICSIIGKFFAAGTFMSTYQQTSELYPTVVRSLGMGMSCTIAMLINLIVPYLIYLRIYGKAIPLLIIGSCCILTGFLASLLPETLNENLPQSIFEAENFGASQEYLSWIRRRPFISKEQGAALDNKCKDSSKDCEYGRKDSQTKNSRKTSLTIGLTPENTTTVDDSLDISKKLRKNFISDNNISFDNNKMESSVLIEENRAANTNDQEKVKTFQTKHMNFIVPSMILVQKEPTSNKRSSEFDEKDPSFSYENMAFDQSEKDCEGVSNSTNIERL